MWTCLQTLHRSPVPDRGRPVTVPLLDGKVGPLPPLSFPPLSSPLLTSSLKTAWLTPPELTAPHRTPPSSSHTFPYKDKIYRYIFILSTESEKIRIVGT